MENVSVFEIVKNFKFSKNKQNFVNVPKKLHDFDGS